ncbi:MAG: amylo-alpha-1,6-glucosidase [Ktedonobacter sp. 13_1_20CM_3_54_15]|nr:MAG: amylo-alpha-1,6-glucosidase [Ktedonobacter sp. 13_2_20CM_53_11]OLB55700.1 MAG: amylo-alpha-1,6-glucosidase [Ktedonobacter sp. 13_2_20CM_2_56_8]OLE35362.1 MAG: amylo-alpha-1,6-glucosidase [Ktedonobacter sp. 13_1_20CM_3_54_15]TMD45262.1 MAG: amylo-alpha-1,6-glucosidase [Chloroflexota bacterium]
MSDRTISVLEGNNFVVSDLRGDIDASPTEPLGLFAWDTRFLSRWLLTVDGQRPNVLSTDDLDYFYVQFFLVPGTGTIYVDADLSIIRKRAVGNGFHEDLTILNHKDQPVELKVRIEAAADFVDLFEVKDKLTKKGECYQRIESDRLVLGYRRETFVRETLITASAKTDIDEHGLSFAVHIEPHGEWTTCLEVVAGLGGLGEYHEEATYGHGDRRARPNVKMSLDKLGEAVPRLSCDWPSLQVTYRRSLIDLAALRFYPMVLPGQALPAAGLPWFMTLFGRDSIITSYQALPFGSRLAVTTLLVLAQRQGTRIDDFRDEEPGKILHEQRFGEMTAFEERPHSPYYGAADVTPLFLILLDEVERWTGNAELVRQLEMEARAALTWIDKYGDRNGDGYVEYDRRNKETGLENQCWKDSWNSIQFADGTISRLPRATCEIQGYVYDAKRRCARLARQLWNDPALAEQLEKEAAELKRRFNQDYWLEDREFFALAIDGDGRKVDSLTSNIGHLLWSGIVEDDKAEAVVRHLMGEKLFSGWGVRTMAEGEGGYNPIGYHVGTVWPHDNSFIAMGLRRYGYREEAAQIAMGMLEAATYFKGRLPEAFAGYPRELTGFPVEYPTACSPQAWASGAPLLLLRAILGLEPVGDHLLVDPALPAMLGQIELLDIPGRWGRVDAFGRGRVDTSAMEDSRQSGKGKDETQ